MLVLAVTLHNIPEGMAVGVVCAGYLAGDAEISSLGVLALALGIAIQNFPEGAIISLPLRAEGESKLRAFAGGVLSGCLLYTSLLVDEHGDGGDDDHQDRHGKRRLGVLGLAVHVQLAGQGEMCIRDRYREALLEMTPRR